jgi:hypothetical protein
MGIHLVPFDFAETLQVIFPVHNREVAVGGALDPGGPRLTVDKGLLAKTGACFQLGNHGEMLALDKTEHLHENCRDYILIFDQIYQDPEYDRSLGLNGENGLILEAVQFELLNVWVFQVDVLEKSLEHYFV